MPAYRNKMWDGKIRLFSDKTGKLYVGLLDYVKEFCDRNDIGYEIDDDVDDSKDIDIQVVEDFIKSLKPKRIILSWRNINFKSQEHNVVEIAVLLDLKRSFDSNLE